MGNFVALPAGWFVLYVGDEGDLVLEDREWWENGVDDPLDWSVRESVVGVITLESGDLVFGVVDGEGVVPLERDENFIGVYGPGDYERAREDVLAIIMGVLDEKM